MEDDLEWQKTQHHFHEIIEMESLLHGKTKIPEFSKKKKIMLFNIYKNNELFFRN